MHLNFKILHHKKELSILKFWKEFYDRLPLKHDITGTRSLQKIVNELRIDASNLVNEKQNLEINYKKSQDEILDLKNSIERLSNEKVNELVDKKVKDIDDKYKRDLEKQIYDMEVKYKYDLDKQRLEIDNLQEKVNEKNLEYLSKYNFKQNQRLEELLLNNTKAKSDNENFKTIINELQIELKDAKKKLLIQENSSKKGGAD